MVDADHITEHFTWNEIRCHDGTQIPEGLIPNAYKLAAQLEILRGYWSDEVGKANAALVPVCWYRSPAHNDALRRNAIAAGRVPGTAANSEHMNGWATDIRPLKMAHLIPFRDLVKGALAAGKLGGIGGWGYYPGQWLHLDCRPRLQPTAVTFWLGQGVASEMAS